MDYHEAANFLFDLRRFRPKPGTDSTATLLAHLGDPHEGLAVSFRSPGSNGKGSTARMTEPSSARRASTSGLYTSPHFDDVRERITVNGRKTNGDGAHRVRRSRLGVRDRTGGPRGLADVLRGG